MSTILVAVALAVALSQSEDETPETAESRGVFVTVGHPNLSAEELELLDGLPRVGSLAELESAITAETAVLVVDQSAIEVVPREFLRAQYGMGREIIAINVHGRDLAEVLSDRSGTWPTPESWAATHDGHGDGAFYSYMHRSVDGGRRGYGQHHFKDLLFTAVLHRAMERAGPK